MQPKLQNLGAGKSNMCPICRADLMFVGIFWCGHIEQIWHREQALLLETETIKHKLLEKPMRVKQGGSVVTSSPLSICSLSRFYLESLCRFVCTKIKMRMNLCMMIFHTPSIPEIKFLLKEGGPMGV